MKKSLSFFMAMCAKGKNSHILFMASVSALLLALSWCGVGWKDWNFGLPSLSVAYDVFVFMSLWILGFRVWHLAFRFEEAEKLLWVIPKLSMKWRKEVCSNGAACAACGAKIEYWKKSTPAERSRRSKELNADEAEEDEVAALREKLAEERKLRRAAVAELEEERAAASSATREAMEKISCLQNKMGRIQREARLCEEMAERKKLHDEQVISTLHWVIMRLEADKTASEEI